MNNYYQRTRHIMQCIICVAGFFSLLFCASSLALDGETLLHDCTVLTDPKSNEIKPANADGGRCLGLVHGVLGAMEIYNQAVKPLHATCFPDQPIKTEQAVRIVKTFLQENPMLWHRSSVHLSVMALKQAFPCSGLREAVRY